MRRTKINTLWLVGASGTDRWWAGEIVGVRCWADRRFRLESRTNRKIEFISFSNFFAPQMQICNLSAFAHLVTDRRMDPVGGGAELNGLASDSSRHARTCGQPPEERWSTCSNYCCHYFEGRLLPNQRAECFDAVARSWQARLPGQ